MSDEWKAEYKDRLNNSKLYKELVLKCSEKDSEVIALVDNAISYAFQRTKTILRHMGEYTLHDGDHLFRVLSLMERLLTESNIKRLSPPELMLLILTAFFHDIGMAPDEREVIAWRKVWDSEPVFENESDRKSFDEFKRFYAVRPDQQEIIKNLIDQGKHSIADIVKSYLITEFIRKTHAERVREIIGRDWNNKIKFREVDLTVEFAQLCYSHNEDALSLLDLDKNHLCGANIFACLPLIGIILRLADILDFDAKRTPSILYSHLYVRHPISIKEWNKHRAVEAWEISPDLIQFSAKCSHPAIEASIHEFCNMIDRELSVCNNINSSLNDFNKGREILIRFPFKVDREKIKTQKNIHNKPLYIYRETQFNLSKRQVVDLLMGTKLYGNSAVALRELLQNSIDACLLRQAQESKWGSPYIPEISIKYYIAGDDIVLEVDDNGTGMDQNIIDNYYSKVGSSFYKSIDFYNLKAESNANFTPTSRFGIGILSCFMVADTLIVDTKRVYAQHKSSDALNITVEGQESIFWIKEGARALPGTTTKLILRKAQNPWDQLSEEQFIKSVENVIPNPPFKINIQTSSHTKTRDKNSFKEVQASSLKDFSWDEHENLKLFDISLDRLDLGIAGSVLVAVLESKGMPEVEVNLASVGVKVEEESYTLEKKMSISDNAILQESHSITINDEGQIDKDKTRSDLARSQSRISLHGIEVPSTLYPNPWQIKNNQVKISWPFPMVLVVDICNNRDLDLNSSRTEIIKSEKWSNFEEELAFLICSEIFARVAKSYWEKLKTILIKKNNSAEFLKGINRVGQS